MARGGSHKSPGLQCHSLTRTGLSPWSQKEEGCECVPVCVVSLIYGFDVFLPCVF